MEVMLPEDEDYEDGIQKAHEWMSILEISDSELVDCAYTDAK